MNMPVSFHTAHFKVSLCKDSVHFNIFGKKFIINLFLKLIHLFSTNSTNECNTIPVIVSGQTVASRLSHAPSDSIPSSSSNNYLITFFDAKPFLEIVHHSRMDAWYHIRSLPTQFSALLCVSCCEVMFGYIINYFVYIVLINIS